MIDEETLCLETFALYQEHGVKFTMGDLAARLGISKKTLSEQVHSKDELVSHVTEHYFVAVARDQVALRANDTIPPLQKVEQILCVVPQLPFRNYRIRELRRAFPDAYLRMTRWLQSGWERTFEVMDEAIAAGTMEPFDKEFFVKMYAFVIEGLITEREQWPTEEFAREQRRAVRMLLCGICSDRGRETLTNSENASSNFKL